ncbi:MAG: glycosyltransferase, partial [Bacteroidaceae bacterium]|nr:glycosyltransferase [Bacteroidaceae bacterium]
MKKLAIVILNWNGAEMMRRYLPSVLENSVGDVVVTDNASTDGSVAMLRKEFPQVPVVVLEQNFGFAEGYN